MSLETIQCPQGEVACQITKKGLGVSSPAGATLMTACSCANRDFGPPKNCSQDVHYLIIWNMHVLWTYNVLQIIHLRKMTSGGWIHTERMYKEAKLYVNPMNMVPSGCRTLQCNQ